MRWQPSDVFRITILNSTDLNVPIPTQPGYTLRQTAFTDTTMTSTLSRVAVEGINVSCISLRPTLTTIGFTTIHLAGELSLHVYHS